jgi:hypothetical protein
MPDDTPKHAAQVVLTNKITQLCRRTVFKLLKYKL